MSQLLEPSCKKDRFSLWLSKKRGIPYRFRRSVMKRLSPTLLNDYPFETEYYGLRFVGNIVNYIDRLVYFCGGHEKYMLRLLSDVVQALRASGQNDIYFADIGANAGNHSLFMSQLADEVYAFEPYGPVREQLQRNIMLNAIQNVRVFDCGLGEEAGVFPCFAGPKENIGATSLIEGHCAQGKPVGEVKIKQGDQLFAEEQLSPITLAKIDVEGFEPHVLKGLKESFKKDRPLIICELSPTSREGFGNEDGFFNAFPEDYTFYYFARGNKETGAYKLKPFTYDLCPKIQDVIAVPKEMLAVI